MKNLSFFDKIFHIINLVVAVLLLVSYVGPYVSAKTLPFLSPINLTVPILVFVNILFFVYWILRRKKQLFVSLAILVLGYFVMQPFYKFNSSKELVDKEDLSIMSFNVRGFNKYDWFDDPNIGNEIIEFIENEAPDVVCFQEHSRIWYKQLSMYPYKSETPYSTGQTVQSIFSKYPIINKGSLDFPNTLNNCIYADILYKKDTVRIYNIHLQSLRVIPTVEAVTTESSDRLYKRLTKSFTKQQEQAQIFLNHVKEENLYKKIVCGDFNNNQYSNVYHSIKGDMIDTFFEKGHGFGKTYDLMGYPLRIDFILVDNDFEVKTHENYDVKLSDHYPVMSSMHLKAQ